MIALLERPVFSIIIVTLVVIFALQVILASLITLSARRRAKRRLPTGYPTIPLPLIHMDNAVVNIYMEGITLFDDMLAAIEAAERTIMFETFIWINDALGRQFIDALARRAAEGIQVYCIYDRIGTSTFGRSRPRFPKHPNFHCLSFLSFQRPWHFLQSRRWNVSHRKLLIVDEEIGFVGGYNLGEEYRTQWRDTHIRFEGHGAANLGYAFVDFWNTYCHPQHEPLDYPRQPWTSHIRAYRNDPLRHNFPIRSTLLYALERAQNHILVTTAYFVPDPVLRRAFKEAARRGVRVGIIFPWQSNHALVDWVARHYFGDYLQSGIELYGYEGTMIHAKTVTVDGIWSLIGTANLDRLSLWSNHEITVEIDDETVAHQMEAIFECDRRNARRLEPDVWSQRPLSMRAGELLLSPFWPLV